MFLLDRMITGGIRFVLDKVIVSAETELNDDSHLRDELMAAQMRVELGEMSQEAFAELEDEILLRIREIRERRGEGSRVIAFDDVDGDGVTGISAGNLSGIEASFVADDIHPGFDASEPAPSELTIDVAPAAVAEAPPSAKKKRKTASGRTTKNAMTAKKRKTTAPKKQTSPTRNQAKASSSRRRT